MRVLDLDIIPSEMRNGCLVCVICNSNSFHSLIFKLSIIHGRCAPLILCTFDFFLIFMGFGLIHFPSEMRRGSSLCVT